MSFTTLNGGILLRFFLAIFNLLLSLGAFYMGASMFLAWGVFSAFPQEWIGIMPFGSWATLAVFGIMIFGIGNAIASVYGFLKKDRVVFIFTILLGGLLLVCSAMPVFLIGEWYLPTVQLLMLGFIQMLLGLFSLFIKKNKKRINPTPDYS